MQKVGEGKQFIELSVTELLDKRNILLQQFETNPLSTTISPYWFGRLMTELGMSNQRFWVKKKKNFFHLALCHYIQVDHPRNCDRFRRIDLVSGRFALVDPPTVPHSY